MMRQSNRKVHRAQTIQRKISKQSRNRLAFVISIVSIFFLVLAGGLVYRTIVQNDELTRRAYEIQSRNKEITSRRGTIFDRTGKPLAISAKVFMVVINPKFIIERNKLSPDTIVSKLAKVLEVDKKTIIEKLNPKSQYYLVKRKVEEKIKKGIELWADKNDVEGIVFEDDYKRYYPNENFASHVLGFLGVDNQGLYGIESTFNDYLEGTSGKISSGLGSNSDSLVNGGEKRIDSTDGYNVHLTIDETIQYFAEKALDKAVKDNKVKNGAVAIVSDPKTGDILAIVSKPDYDPNNPYAIPKIAGLDLKKWGTGRTEEAVKILNETVWRNHAISDTYEPGSTFKAITASAGLEDGIVSQNTRVTDATINVSGRFINCWKKTMHGVIHGWETFKEAVYNSCNPVFSVVAQKLGVTKFYEYAKSFGFTSKTGISLPGEGINLMHSDPTVLDMSVAAFGQRFTVTPIQMIMAYGALANGGTLYEPRLVTEISDNYGNVIEEFEPKMVRRVISQKTSDVLRDILTGVVEEGTGSKAYVAGYSVAGKTGTSQTTDETRYIASFSGFAPADNPKICVLVVLDNPKGDSHMGGTIAAPVASKIFEETLSYMKVPRKYSEK